MTSVHHVTSDLGLPLGGTEDQGHVASIRRCGCKCGVEGNHQVTSGSIFGERDNNASIAGLFTDGLDLGT